MKKKLIILSCLIAGSFFVFANEYAELELFAHVLNTIQSEYFKPKQKDKLIHGAIQGLLRELDPHSQFFTPKEFKKFSRKGTGLFYGVGLELAKKQGFLIVISVLQDSPAKKAGFKEGDHILALNDQAVKHLTLQEFLQLFQKKSKISYKVTVLRKNKPLFLYVKPSFVKVQPLFFKVLKEGLVYVRIFQFSENTFFKLNKFLKIQKVKGLVLDLRNNPGGLLDEAIKISDLFLDKGSIVSLKVRSSKKRKTFFAKKSTTLPFFPMVVLINKYSASASEIVAGALKDHKRATLLGRKSFGKGSVQNVFHLPRDYALKLTVGEYQTPSGVSIHERGIKPDIFLLDPEKEVSFSLKNIMEDSDIKTAFKKLKHL